MESLEITEDWSVELITPLCDLRLDSCSRHATQGMRVHGCTFHYSCNSCAHEFIRRVSKGVSMYRQMRCKDCKKKFARGDKFFNIVGL